MQERKFNDIFWPLLLIGLGVIWLLSNFELLPRFSINAFLSLWPLILVAVGVNLLLGPRFPALRPWIAVGTLALAFALVLMAPNLGLQLTPEFKEAHFSEPLGVAESARVELDLSIGETEIQALEGGGNLIEADITYIGISEFEASGAEQKTIYLQAGDDSNLGSFFNFGDAFDAQGLHNDIRLNPDVPLDLIIHAGIGILDLDLSGLRLASLKVNGGVGEIRVALPAQEEHYSVEIDGGVGRVSLKIQEGTNVSLDLSGGVGDFSVDLPNDAPVLLNAEIGVGGIRVPAFLNSISVTNDFVGMSGTWESSAYSSASERIDIKFEGGIGSFIVR